MKRIAHRARSFNARRQGGYTLIEAGFAVVIASIIAAAGLTAISKRADGFRVERAQQEMKLWLEAGLQYRRDTGNWPANTAALTGGSYMPASAVTGPFGGSYTIAPVAGNSRLRVTYNATQAKFANLISATLPLASVAGTTVNGEVVVPGMESSHDALLPRDGSRPMTGSLNMNGNHIINTGNVTGTGNFVTPGYMQSNILYDYYNSAYYVQARGTSRLNEVQADRVYGFADIRTPILYDYNDTGYYVDPSYVSDLNYIYARSYMVTPLLYDRNDTNYYLDPNGTSRLNAVYANSFYDYGKGVYNDQAVHHVTDAGSGQAIGKPSCYGGHSPRIFTAVSKVSDDATASPLGAAQTWAVDAGSVWYVYMKVYSAQSPSGRVLGSSSYGRILVITKCE